MQLIDIGANLTSRRFHKDLPQVLERARQAGVVAQWVTGTSIAASQDAIALADSHPELYATVGIHPHEASSFNAAALTQLADMAAHAKVVAIGETGLDFNRDFSPRPMQEKSFAEHLQLAARLNKPVFLHQRDAHERFLPLLKEQRDQLARAVVHCFTGNKRELFDYLDLDCHIGITGWVCDSRRGADLRELVAHIPADRLLIETDAPYLLPHNLDITPTEKGRNEPAFLPFVLKELARCRQQNEAELAALTYANSQAFMSTSSAA